MTCHDVKDKSGWDKKRRKALSAFLLFGICFCCQLLERQSFLSFTSALHQRLLQVAPAQVQESDRV